MGRIYLIRHGETTSNRAATFVGSTDMPLNDEGFRQAGMIADYLADRPIEEVYSSGLTRARQTAQSVADRFGLPVIQVPELNELDYGEWEGISEEVPPVRCPQFYKEWRANPLEMRPPGGETFADLRDRAYPALIRIAEENCDREIVVVAHKSTNRMLLCCLTGRSINEYKQVPQENAAINVLDVSEDGCITVEQINQVSHLHPAP